MLRYRRLPAALVLVVGLAAGVLLVLLRGGAFAANDASLTEIEQAIASGQVTPDTWMLYAQKLSALKQDDKAWKAYEQVLQSQPYNRIARFEGALALARSGDREILHTYLRSVVYTEPKLAVELFNRRELAFVASETRFKAMEKEARSQAMD